MVIRSFNNFLVKSINRKLKAVILLSLFSSLLMLCAAEEVSKVRPVETPAINLWVDTLLGVISEDEAKEKMKSLRPPSSQRRLD